MRIFQVFRSGELLLLICSVLLLCCAPGAGVAGAQESTSSVTGAVSDASGAGTGNAHCSEER